MFSIILPCYNLEKYIKKSIESILNQTYKEFELIIVDDGSTDESLNIIQSFQKEDERIKLIKKSNGGVSTARNMGIKEATGEYILFFDGDDLIEKNTLEILKENFDRNKTDMVSFGYKKIDSGTLDTLKHYSSNKFDSKKFTGTDFLKKFLLKKIDQHICSFGVKKKVLDTNNLYFDENTHRGEDIEFQIKCMSKCRSVLYLDKELFFYCMRQGSAVNREYIRSDFEVYLRIYHYLEIGNLDLLQSYNNYMAVKYLSIVKEIYTKGSNKKTVKNAMKLDFFLYEYEFSYSFYDIYIIVFRVLYKALIRKNLMKKYLLVN